MTVTKELIEKYQDKTRLRRPSLAIVIEKADTEDDIENMLFHLGGYYTSYVCDECDAPMIREFKEFDYYIDSPEDEGDIYRCMNGHRFQVGGKFFSGVKRVDS